MDAIEPRELSLADLILTATCMLLGTQGIDFDYYENDADWWHWRLWGRRNKMMKGWLTNLLGQKYRDLGYQLTEDEDFLYLHIPGKQAPVVYSNRAITIKDVHDYIDRQRDLELWN